VGSVAAVSLGVVEDFGLLAAGAVGIVAFLKSRWDRAGGPG
jgi:hypothetical protein